MSDEKKPTVSVKSDYTGGITLRLFEQVDNGIEPARSRATGERISLSQGENPGIDKALWERWLEQNKGTIQSKMLTASDEES